jgi:DNA-binding GntR family transcriptional regulator
MNGDGNWLAEDEKIKRRRGGGHFVRPSQKKYGNFSGGEP